MDPFSALELSTQEEQEQSNISFDYIDWIKFKEFDQKETFVQYTGLSEDTLRALPSDHLKPLQYSYYTQMLAKELPPPQQQQELFFDGPSKQRGDQYVAYESRKRASDNSPQFDRIMKVSKVAPPHKKIARYSSF